MPDFCHAVAENSTVIPFSIVAA